MDLLALYLLLCFDVAGARIVSTDGVCLKFIECNSRVADVIIFVMVT